MNDHISELQKKAYSLLKDELIRGLNKGELSPEESQTAAQFILRNVQTVESYQELLLFLRSLGETYPAFKEAFIVMKQEATVSDDQKKLEELQARLKELTTLKT